MHSHEIKKNIKSSKAIDPAHAAIQECCLSRNMEPQIMERMNLAKKRVLLLSADQTKPVYNQNGRLKTERFYPPMGLGYLSAVASHAGYIVKVVDTTEINPAALRKIISDFDPHVTGISCFTEHRGGALDLARAVKALNKETVVVFGGSHVTFMHEQILKNYPEVDFCVIGEGELTFVELLNNLFSGSKDFTSIAGIAYRSGLDLVVTSPRPMVADLDVLPFPDRAWVERSLYSEPYAKELGLRLASIMPARGCPFGCQFCSTSMFWGKRTRIRSVANVMAEIDSLWAEGFRYIEFIADAFTLDQKVVQQVCQAVIEKGYKFPWRCGTRAGTVSPETALLMKQAGCLEVVMGIETLSPRILQTIGKKYTIQQAEETVENLRVAGIQSTCLLMIGNPGDNLESIRETIFNLGRIKPDIIYTNLTQVYPGTPLYFLAKEQGFMDDNYWLDETKASPIYLVENSLEDLVKFDKMIGESFILQKRQYLRWFSRKTGLGKKVSPILSALMKK
jgi:anaerobic magnesium-protoporphyrin IX monomethyl ester cyclase